MSDLDKQTPAASASKLPPDLATAPLSTASSQIAAFTARRADVARSDHEEFQAYLQAKQEHARQTREQEAAQPRTKTRPRLTRRGMLSAAGGTAIALEAATLAYDASNKNAAGGGPNAAVAAEPQNHPINREMIDSRADVGGRASVDGLRCCRPRWVAARMRST